jgi:hypothetical protein
VTDPRRYSFGDSFEHGEGGEGAYYGDVAPGAGAGRKPFTPVSLSTDSYAVGGFRGEEDRPAIDDGEQDPAYTHGPPRSTAETLYLGRAPLRDRRGGKVFMAAGLLVSAVLVVLVGRWWLQGGGDTPDAPAKLGPSVTVDIGSTTTAPLDPPLPPVQPPDNITAHANEATGFGLAYPANWKALDLAGGAQEIQDFLKTAGGNVDLTSQLLTSNIQNGGVFFATDPATGDPPGRAAVVLSIVAGGPLPPDLAAASAAPAGEAPQLVVGDVTATLTATGATVVDATADTIGEPERRVVKAGGQVPVPTASGPQPTQYSSLDFLAAGRHWRLTMVGLDSPAKRMPFLEAILNTFQAVERPT